MQKIGRLFKEMSILLTAFIAVMYMILPSLIPDVIPFIGALDEGAATLIILSTLKYYGIDLTGIYGVRYTRQRRRKATFAPRVTRSSDQDRSDL